MKDEDDDKGDDDEVRAMMREGDNEGRAMSRGYVIEASEMGRL